MSANNDLLFATMEANSEKSKGDFTGAVFEENQRELQEMQSSDGAIIVDVDSAESVAVIEWPFDGKGGLYTYNDGHYLDSQGQRVASDEWAHIVVPVDGIHKIHTNLIHENQGVFFASDGRCVQFTVEDSKDFEGKCGRTITVPDGVETVGLNINKTQYHHGNPDHLAQYFSLWTDDVLNQPLAGKRILCIGDSITYLDGKYGNGDGSPFVGWQAELRKRGAMVDTFAWSGAILGHTTEPATIIYSHITYSVDNGLLDVSDYDIVVIFAGTNDVYCKIGRDYFSANIHNTIDLIRGYNPTAQIYMVNIMPSFNDKDRALADIEAYNGTLEATAAGLNVPTIDMYGELGVNLYTSGIFFYDSVHPNSRGMKRVGRIIAEKLNAVLSGKSIDTIVTDKDYLTASEVAKVTNSQPGRFYDSPLAFGARNDSDLTAIVTAMPDNSTVVFWINNDTFPAVFNEIATHSGKIGVDLPFGIVTVRKFHNVTRVKWENYESMATLVNGYSDINSVGWSGWKVEGYTELDSVAE